MSLRHFLWIEGLAAAAILGTLISLSVGPQLIGYSAFVVYGGSMEPGIPTGSVAVGKPVSAESLRVGDVIAFKSGGSTLPTLHRIVEIEGLGKARTITTKGDANGSNDPVKTTFSGSGSRIVYAVPWTGYILHASLSTWSRHAFMTLPALALGGMVLWSIWRPSLRSVAGRRNRGPRLKPGLR